MLRLLELLPRRVEQPMLWVERTPFSWIRFHLHISPGKYLRLFFLDIKNCKLLHAKSADENQRSNIYYFAYDSVGLHYANYMVLLNISFFIWH